VRRIVLVWLVVLAHGVLAAGTAIATAAKIRPVLVVHPRLVALPDNATGARVGGDWALIRIGGFGSDRYAVFDDRTQRWRRVTGGCEPELGPFLGPPWVLFDCGDPAELYNLQTRRWRTLECAEACVNTGVAAVAATGSDWVEYNEDAFCDPKVYTCDGGFEFVQIPSGATRTITPGPGRYIDLNSLALVRPLCRPLPATEPGGWTFYGRYAVGEDRTGLFVERCGSRRRVRLIAITPGSAVTAPQGNAHAIFSCNNSTYEYSGLLIPSMRRFTLALPSRARSCEAQLGTSELYIGPWQAPFSLH
jgi:hypothetical protein